MGKLPWKVRGSKQTREGAKGPSRCPELSKKRLASKRRMWMWMWHRHGRARPCFFSKARQRDERKRRSVCSSPSCNHPGAVKIICMQTQVDPGRDENLPEHTPDKGRETPTSGVVDGGELQAGSGEVCQPASPSTSTPTDCPQTRAPEDLERSVVGTSRARCMRNDTIHGVEKVSGDQKPRGGPVSHPQEACATPGAEQAMADGKTSSRTNLSSVCKSLPGDGVSSEDRLALVKNITEFLDGFSNVYGSFIPLQKCDFLRSLEWPNMNPQRKKLVLSVLNKYNSARTKSPSFQVVYKKHRLTLEDLSTLADDNWLNDQVINMYGELIMDSTHNQVHFLNSFFHHQLEMKGYKGVRRWTKQVNLFAKRLLLVPIHMEVHWCLVSADPTCRRIQLYDSSECTASLEVAQKILKHLTSEAEEKSQKYFQTGWVVSDHKETPQQNNENDCGVFVLEYCKRLAREEPLTFSQEEIPNIRKRIYKELCERKLHV